VLRVYTGKPAGLARASKLYSPGPTNELIKEIESMMKSLVALVCAGALSACGGGSGGADASPSPSPLQPTGEPVARPWQEVLSTSQTHTIQGDVRIIENFPMPQLNRTRRIWIYVPADYAQSGANYPVLYLQDGQNVFDVATSFVGEWGVDEAMLQLEQEDPRLKAIVVAIDNGGGGKKRRVPGLRSCQRIRRFYFAQFEAIYRRPLPYFE
jgi:hypothetical protein